MNEGHDEGGLGGHEEDELPGLLRDLFGDVFFCDDLVGVESDGSHIECQCPSVARSVQENLVMGDQSRGMRSGGCFLRARGAMVSTALIAAA